MWRKRASFFQKRLYWLLFFKKSLLCRYSALSLHSETDERWSNHPVNCCDSEAENETRVSLSGVPYLSMTLLWLGRVSKLPLLSLCATVALASLWLRSRRRRKAQGNAAAETRHKREVFDIFAYWFFSRWMEPLRELARNREILEKIDSSRISGFREAGDI